MDRKLTPLLLEEILRTIGDDPSREGLVDTPNRIVKSWKELYAGYNQNPEDILTTFKNDGSDGVDYDSIVLLRDVEIYSQCEHHQQPFFGHAHIAYIPGDRVVGISKLARLVEIYARRLQIQERIGQQVIADINKYLKPRAAACIITAKHLCMSSRGVGKQNSSMVTSSLSGAFKEDASSRQELMELIKL